MAAKTNNVKEELSKKAGSIRQETRQGTRQETVEAFHKPEKANASKSSASVEDTGASTEVDNKRETQFTGSENCGQEVQAEKEEPAEINVGFAKTEKQEQIVRLLRANEIECRIGTISEKGLSLLLFKDARVDQKILDETFSPFGWKRTHQCIDGNLYCTVEIWDENKEQWIAKQDVGTTSYSEKEKGQASDSFKRACFNWGVGRELYSAPFIWIPAKNTNIDRKDNRFYTNDHFSVREISYNEYREIASLSIVNQKGEEVYHMKEKQSNKGLSETQIKALEKELERTGVALSAVLDRYHIQKLEQMTNEIYTNAINSLRKTKNVA